MRTAARARSRYAMSAGPSCYRSQPDTGSPAISRKMARRPPDNAQHNAAFLRR